MSEHESYADALARYYASVQIPKKYSPAALIDGWQTLIENCATGYSFDISEYDNDLEVRRYIQLMLEAPELQGFTEFEEFAQQVYKSDIQFRALLLINVVRPAPTVYRWDRGILKHAGQTCVEDIASLYGIQVLP